MNWLAKLKRRDAVDIDALYAQAVALAREPHWYVEGAVPDTLDGRFDAIAAVLAQVLLRLEAEPEGTRPAVRLAERFVDDMDPQLREIGIGDMTVGKHMGRMMAALGGRLGAYREAGDDAARLEQALVRNVYRGSAPSRAALAHVGDALVALRARLAEKSLDAILAGDIA